MFEFHPKGAGSHSKTQLSSQWVFILMNTPLVVPFVTLREVRGESEAAPLFPAVQNLFPHEDNLEALFFREVDVDPEKDTGENSEVEDPDEEVLEAVLGVTNDPSFRDRIFYEGAPPT